jgi:hypothetical protein
MNLLNRYYILFIFQAHFGVIYSDILFSYEPHFTKGFKLYNGNIVLAGDRGIYTYDNKGITLLYNYTFNEVQINKDQDGYYTNIVQFPKKYNGLVIVLVYHILYYLNSDGKFLYKYELNLEIKSVDFHYYSIVPIIYKDNKYHFILGYINSNNKGCLKYYVINPKNNETAFENFFVFDDQKNNDYGINCEIMKLCKFTNT